MPFVERLLGSMLGALGPPYPFTGRLHIHHSDTVIYMVRFHLCWNLQDLVFSLQSHLVESEA